MVVPSLAYLAHPLTAGAATEAVESPLGPTRKFEEGKPQKVRISATRVDAWLTQHGVEVGSVWVLKQGDDFKVWSTVCPHLGCAIQPKEGGFQCPCHNSQFGVGGERTGDSNPSPRDMDSLPNRVDEGVLYCTYKRFKPGVKEQVEA